MTTLRLGPLLRHVDTDSATVWMETAGPCTVRVSCGEPDRVVAEATARTFQVAGHHYALVAVEGLPPGSESPYRVRLEDDGGVGAQVWPLAGSPYPPSRIRTLPDPAGDAGGGTPHPFRLTFGSCRWATPYSDRDRKHHPDALDTLALRLATQPDAEWPDALLLLGDQVYADNTSPPTREWLAERRAAAANGAGAAAARRPDAPSTPPQPSPPEHQVADFEEYTHLYDESWLDPEIRWLLASVPSMMIFDDHDVIDDWNTSDAWRREIRAEPWWRERILGGLVSYWIYQHLGNLSPAELAADKLFAAVREAEDGEQLLREHAERADTETVDPSTNIPRKGARWSYRRDFGRVRLLVLDSRCGRILDPEQRAIIAPEEMDWLRAQALDGDYDHLLIGSGLPWLLPPAIHDLEMWNEAICAGERGPRFARLGEKTRRLSDLEHWPAFRRSFEELTELLGRISRHGPDGGGPPGTVCVLSGDVHHAYVAEAAFPIVDGPGADAGSTVLQLTCSPVHNRIPAVMRGAFRLGWNRTGRVIGRAFARHGRVRPVELTWRRRGGPWFGNQLMTFTARGRAARTELFATRRERDGRARLDRVAGVDAE